MAAGRGARRRRPAAADDRACRRPPKLAGAPHPLQLGARIQGIPRAHVRGACSRPSADGCTFFETGRQKIQVVNILLLARHRRLLVSASARHHPASALRSRSLQRSSRSSSSSAPFSDCSSPPLPASRARSLTLPRRTPRAATGKGHTSSRCRASRVSPPAAWPRRARTSPPPSSRCRPPAGRSSSSGRGGRTPLACSGSRWSARRRCSPPTGPSSTLGTPSPSGAGALRRRADSGDLHGRSGRLLPAPSAAKTLRDRAPRRGEPAPAVAETALFILLPLRHGSLRLSPPPATLQGAGSRSRADARGGPRGAPGRGAQQPRLGLSDARTPAPRRRRGEDASAGERRGGPCWEHQRGQQGRRRQQQQCDSRRGAERRGAAGRRRGGAALPGGVGHGRQVPPKNGQGKHPPVFARGHADGAPPGPPASHFRAVAPPAPMAFALIPPPHPHDEGLAATTRSFLPPIATVVSGGVRWRRAFPRAGGPRPVRRGCR